MPLFRYAAVDIDAGHRTGEIMADTPRQVRDRLREQGLSIQNLIPRPPRKSLSLSSFMRGLPGAGGRGLKAKGTEVVRDLSTLLAVGVPIHEAVGMLANQHRGVMRQVLLEVSEKLASGTGLAESLRQSAGPEGEVTGGVFDEVTLNMMAVGEDTGRLDEVLGQVADFQQRGAQLKGRVLGALLYPLVVSVVGLGVCLFLMTAVVPDLLKALTDSGRPLPLATRIVKGASDFLLLHGPTILLAGVVLLVGFVVTLRTDRVRLFWDRLMLHLPGVGGMIRKQAVVRICFVIATAMRSGLTFEQALKLARSAVKNRVLCNALDDCGRAIEQGQGIGAGLAATHAFPPAVNQVFELGQQSGNLEEVLDRLATAYDHHLTTSAHRLTTLLEPALIVGLAIVVGLIAFATILPILEIGNVM